MDILELVVRSEWPAVAIAAIVIFNRPIARLLDRMRPTKFSAWGVSVELDKAEALTVETRALTKQETPSPSARDQTWGRLFNLEEEDVKSPQIVVMKSWKALEDAIWRAGSVGPLPAKRYGRTLEQIATSAGLTLKEVEAIIELRNIFNRVIHDTAYELSIVEALRFNMLAGNLIVRLGELKSSENA